MKKNKQFKLQGFDLQKNPQILQFWLKFFACFQCKQKSRDWIRLKHITEIGIEALLKSLFSIQFRKDKETEKERARMRERERAFKSCKKMCGILKFKSVLKFSSSGGAIKRRLMSRVRVKGAG